MSEIELRSVLPEDRPAVKALYREHGTVTPSLIIDEQFYEWQFRGLAEADSSVVVVEDGRIISFLGILRVQVSTPAQKRSGGQLMSWLSVPSARGGGVGTLLMKHMTDRYDFMFGKGVSPEALAVYHKFGFRYLPRSARWLLVTDAAAAAAMITERSSVTVKRLQARQVQSLRSPLYDVSRTVPANAERTSSVALADAVAFIRSRRYLSWRYEQHPLHDYRFVSVGDGALAVVREERCIETGGLAVRVAEFFESPAVRGILARALVDYAKQRQAAFIDLIGVSERFVSGFVATGGFLQGEEPDVRLPYEFGAEGAGRTTPDLLFYSRIRSDGGLPVHADLTRMYISRGDASIEWPSILEPWSTTDPIRPPESEQFI